MVEGTSRLDNWATNTASPIKNFQCGLDTSQLMKSK